MFDWEDLRYFAVFAREKSLSAAARQLKVDHATIARRITALETSLNLKLVDRRPRSYLLTDNGKHIAALGAKMEDEAFAVGRAAMAGQLDLTGEVSVSAPPTMANALIAPHLGKLRRQYPGIHIRLIGETRIASLLHRESDIAVRMFQPTENNLVARKVGSMSFSMYASIDYLSTTPPENYTFIAFDRSMENIIQQKWLKEFANTRPIVLRTFDLETQRIAAMRGVGVAALPYYVANREPGLKLLDIESNMLINDIWLVVHNDLRNVPAVRAVLDFLVECFKT
ncbi:LysR family transcriptional regulator [Methylotenera versatilis]|uniref:Transcriptional regulator, LysR family n=1 Tax=Methylotenera versatilis (strain 301) TaxID=666681 RepID=D7DPH1_METV0|nr:LysR family transcriptional regulator [Methylotenera versatilis]ADI29215.1 transcriptional regulator, LysR family [Methylotenera versatilis 301]